MALALVAVGWWRGWHWSALQQLCIILLHCFELVGDATDVHARICRPVYELGTAAELLLVCKAK